MNAVFWQSVAMQLKSLFQVILIMFGIPTIIGLLAANVGFDGMLVGSIAVVVVGGALLVATYILHPLRRV